VSTPGATCRRNEIRDNTIVVATPSFDPDSPVGRTFNAVDGAPSMITGVPLGLYTLGDPRENANGVEETVIEGNTVTGAIGLGIELVRAAGNRVTNNTVTGIRRREPFPGNIVGFPPAWAEANGAGIWISSGSDENEIVGNTFTDIAAHAVVLEGDRNVVETLSVGDECARPRHRQPGDLERGGAGCPIPSEWTVSGCTISTSAATGCPSSSRPGAARLTPGQTLLRGSPIGTG
jgi:parallel beta-helix repeat protein